MRTKLLLWLLLIPQLGSAYYASTSCCDQALPCGWWGSAEYILWWRKPRFFPPLVTTNPAAVPALTDPATVILFGDATERRGPKSGGRADFGIWFVRKCLGLGGSFVILGDENVNYQLDTSEGIPIFGQPFFDVTAGAATANVLNFPPELINGYIDIHSVNRLRDFDIYLRYRMLGSCCFKLDLLGGFFYCTLADKLDVNTQSTFIPGAPDPNVFTATYDQFDCENNYYAGLVGMVAELRTGCWGLVLTGKAGIGNMHKRTEITGTTTTIIPTTTLNVFESDVGFLAQPNNLGIHKNRKFEVLTQANATLQLRFCRNAWLTLGYTYMFWPEVVLAGRQVNLNLNPAPAFVEDVTSYWMQGLNAGLYVAF